MITVQADNICKNYNRQNVLNNISLFASEKYSVAITGKNGSGKSTLIKILTRFVTPTSGRIFHYDNNFLIQPEKLNNYFSIVAPYLMLYEELTALEHLRFVKKLKKINNASSEVELLKQFSLFDSGNKKVGSFSSGMIQRLRYCIALISNPKILLLDEPTSNLDSEGEDLVYFLMKSAKKNNITLIFATNHKKDLKYADCLIDLSERAK